MLALLALGAGGCMERSTAPEPRTTESVVVRWNEAELATIRSTHLGPPMVARAIAITNTAMYDAWAADEAGMSRRYGGIHFREGDLQSRAMGRLVGAQAWAKARSYFDGSAAPAQVVRR